MNDDFLKEIKETNESFGSNKPFEAEKQEAVDADYTVTSKPESSQNNIPEPTTAEEPKEPIYSNEPKKTTKKPKSFKALFVILGLILGIILIIIGFNMLLKQDVDLTDQENTDTNLTDVNNTDIQDLSNLAEDQNTDSTENVEDLDTNTGTEDLSEVQEILLNCEEYTHTNQTTSYLHWPGALVNSSFEYNVIGFNDSNECEVETKTLSAEYIFEKDLILEYLNNPENKLPIFTQTAILMGVPDIDPDNLNNTEYLNQKIDEVVEEQKTKIAEYYDNLTEEDQQTLNLMKESMNSTDYTTMPIQKCYVSDLEYMPKLLGLSNKSLEDSMDYLLANSEIGISINQEGSRVEYNWGYCIQEQP